MRLAILGASGHGKVVADTALQAGWQDIVFFDDAWPNLKLNGAWPVMGDSELLARSLDSFDGVVVGVGNNTVRLRKTYELASLGARLATLVHPRAVVSPYAELGPGSVVFAGAVLQVDCRLGMSCIVNTGATIDHDCRLGAGVHISPGVNLAGGVRVGDCSWIGIGSTVKQLVCIGSEVMVGVGAAVIADVPDGQTVIGVPARTLSRE